MIYKIIYLKAFIVLLSICVCNCMRYENFTLYRGIPVNQRHMSFFKDMPKYYQVNFWRDPGNLFYPVEFIIGPNDRPLFLEEAQKEGVYLATIIKDVQQVFDQQKIRTYVRRKMDSFDWQSYYRLNDIYAWLYDLANTYPKEVEVINIGKTFEGREILAVKLILQGSLRRSRVIMEGGIHAREWISPAVVTYLIYQLLHATESRDQHLTEIARTYEFLFVPVLNPDGYEYTHTTDRLWRKNRRKYGNHYGVDINRNFGVAFGTVGVSKMERAETYCGPEAFSEAESHSMANFIRSNSKNLEYYIAFHSYGQHMIIPYTYTRKHMDNFEEVKGMCKEAAGSISKRRGTTYTIGTSYDTVGYISSGVSGCWTKRAFKVPYVVTLELPDEGQNGFGLPENEIKVVCEETFKGIVSFLRPRTHNYTKLQETTDNGTCLKVYKFITVLAIIISFE